MKWLRRFNTLFFFEELIVAFLILILITLSISPNFYFYFKTPVESIYTFLHNSVSDYPYYVSFIRQGIYDRTTTIDQFTTEPQSSGFIHIFYLWLGRIGGVFSLSPILIYFLARVILGVIFLLVSYRFIAYFLKLKWQRLLAFIFFISSSSFPHVVRTDKGIEFWPFLSWWTEIDPFRRATFIPHFLMGRIGLAAGLLLLLYLFETYNIRYLLYAVIVGVVVGLAHPPSLGMIYYILGMYFVTKLIFFTSRNFFLISPVLRALLFVFLFVLFTSPSLIYIHRTTNNIFPWTLMKAQESLFYAISLPEYFLALGPIFVLGLLGILFSFKGESLILTLWVIIDIVMIPLSRVIAFTPLPLRIPTFANIRFLSMAIQLPLAILAVFFLVFVKEHFGKKFFWVIIGLYTILTIIMYPGSISGQLQDFSSVPQFVYPKKALIEAFNFLEDFGNEEDVVLTSADNSLLLPFFARNKIYFGQNIYTNNNISKSKEAEEFFAGGMTKCEAYKLVNEGKIHYLLIDEDRFKEKMKQYSFLKQTYAKDQVYIYEVLPPKEKELGCG